MQLAGITCEPILVPTGTTGARAVTALAERREASFTVAHLAGAGSRPHHGDHRPAAVAHRRALCRPGGRTLPHQGHRIGLDETAAKRGHTYVTVFIDLDRTDKPVVFVTPGRGKDTVAKFKAFLATHGGSPGRIVEVVCDMSGAFIAAIGESFDNAAITVDWFHVVQLFTKALDEVRRAEARHSKLPKALRWAILKRADGRLTEAQAAALAELEASDLFTAIAWRIKEKLRWVRQAQSVQAARWRITNFLRHASEILDPDPILDPIRKALATVETHSKRILQRWTSSHSNARLEGLNGLFQAARARARGYRNVTTFATMIYMIAAPLGDLFQST